MERKHERKSSASRLRLAVYGLILMMIGDIIADASLVVKEIVLLNYVELGTNLLGWLLIIGGMLSVKNRRKEFRYATGFSFVGIMAIFVQCAFLFREVRNAALANPFIDIYVMFAEYVSDMCMIGIFYYVVRGVGQLLAKNEYIDIARNSIKLSNIGAVLIVVSMIMVPFASIFPQIVSIIIGGIAIILAVLVKVKLIGYITRGMSKADL